MSVGHGHGWVLYSWLWVQEMVRYSITKQGFSRPAGKAELRGEGRESGLETREYKGKIYTFKSTQGDLPCVKLSHKDF